MSTPSTATALPPPLDITNPYSYNYNHHQHHGILHNHSRLPAPVHYQPPPSPLANASVSSVGSTATRTTSAMASRTQESSVHSSVQRRTGRRRTPDWNEFYRNGVPEEVIVIGDSPSPPPQQPVVNSRTRQIPSGPRGTNGAQYTNGNSISNGQPRHADKKRKVQASHYEPVYPKQEPTYSATHTPQLNGGYGSPTTVSAHSSTASLHGTTAGTSLTTNGSIGAVTANGQKRKRVTRASQAAAAAANTLDAFASYHPPPRPPIKAKEVYVQPIRDTENASQQRVDDQDGHYIVTPDTDLTSRYRITKLLGQGTFGKVVEAYDRTKRTKCAIKVIRSVQKYRDASRIELRVLSTLSCNDKENKNKCIHLRDCFDYRNHICIVTDLLGISVFDFLKANAFSPFPSSHIQSFARQLLTSVAFLHDLNLIHTDLKPENILLVNNGYQTFPYNRAIPSSSNQTQRQGRNRRVLLDTEIRLIDFGSATFDEEYHSSVVSTRHYRAPEIILGLGWSFPCDIWSIGCILVEFYTGDALFQTHDNLEHLAMMQAVCGPKIDSRLVRQIAGKGSGSTSSTNNASKFFRGQRLDYPSNDTSRASKKYVNAMKNLNEIIPSNSSFNKQFLDLLKKIFVYDPNKRITAKDALKHPWFREVLQDEGTEAARCAAERIADAEQTRAYRESGD
ncbi:kinase-like domain-containing protein [Geopyxis carbonaria]|nr:kinase-like domain-containing protein [Geopyxis carbonaria]